MKPRTHFLSGMAYCALLLLGATTHASAQSASAHLVASEPAGVSRSSLTAADYAIAESGFARAQLRNSRVRRAQVNARPRINRVFRERGIRHPAAEVFVRVFKRDRELEVWVRPVDSSRFQLLKTYGICALAGKPGPKRRQGDEQVPEGFYHIDLFNPNSSYHLSMRVSYPNAHDEAVNRGAPLGGDIYIHGGCLSEGCLAMTDEGIEELYWLGIEAHAMGQMRIPVHIFPARLDQAELRRMKDVFSDQPELLEFWKTLQPGYEFFEKNHRLPQVFVDARGTYRMDRRDG
jgi:murein L,D-transpeptidase YafK